MEIKHYPDFVLSRFKSPELTKTDIENNVTAKAVALLHAVIGMSGELTEYRFSDSEENIREELGDFIFYFEAALLNAEPITFTRYDYSYAPPGVASYREAYDYISKYTGALLDLSKKETIYAKPLDQEKTNARYEAFMFVHAALHCIASFHGYTVEQLAKENQAKLEKRFPIGYSNTAADARADKA